jgi:hypothetical protein
MNATIIGLGLVMLYIFPKLTGKLGKQGWFVSGPIGFVVVVLGILT